jgi:hypothetical protein
MSRSAGSVLVRAALPVAVLAAVVVGTVAQSLARQGGQPSSGTPVVRLPASAPVAFFSGCDDLLAYYREHGRRLVGPYGLPGDAVDMMTRASGAEADLRAPVPVAQPAEASATGTNVQVAGVDEADVVKRSGNLLLTLTGNSLHVARIDGGQVTSLGVLRLGGWWPTQLLVDGDVALLLGQRELPMAAMRSVPTPSGMEPRVLMPGRIRPISRLAQVDLQDPSAPRLVRTLDVDGGLDGARLVGGQARIAVTTPPSGLRFVYPLDPTSGVHPAQALTRNRAVIEGSSLRQWLPGFTMTDYGADGRPLPAPQRGMLLKCTSVAAPRAFSGLETLSLLTFDLHRPAGIAAWSGAGVVAAGATVYATADHTYVAATRWMNRTTTQVHLFDTPADGVPRYVASGTVPGYPLGQFALDEYQGYLRVATTRAPAQTPARTQSEESQVSVLAVRGDRLVRVGEVAGLGRGETIRAVRFIGPLGYVVTFRQTDPLYTVDLSRPDRPTVAGELKLPGYSGYLHPIGDGLLLGLGQDADAAGQQLGLQLSLFDVTDPAEPRRLDRVALPGAYSDAEGDHHAFTFADGLALAPYTGTGVDGDVDGGILAVRVHDDRLAAPVTLHAEVAQPWDGAPMRTLVVDGFVYTVTSAGVAVHDAGTLERIGFTPY